MNKFIVILLVGIIAACGSAAKPQAPVEDAPRIDLEAFVKDHWTEEEKANAAIVVDFVYNIMNRHDFDYIRTKYKDSPYVQHNRNAPDGIEGVITFVGETTGNFPEFSYDVKHIIVDDDLVMLHSHGTVEKSHRGDDSYGFNLKDTWRIENGKIVAHWDSVQPIDFSMRLFMLLQGGTVRNSNGVFGM